MFFLLLFFFFCFFFVFFLLFFFYVFFFFPIVIVRIDWWPYTGFELSSWLFVYAALYLVSSLVFVFILGMTVLKIVIWRGKSVLWWTPLPPPPWQFSIQLSLFCTFVRFPFKTALICTNSEHCQRRKTWVSQRKATLRDDVGFPTVYRRNTSANCWRQPIRRRIIVASALEFSFGVLGSLGGVWRFLFFAFSSTLLWVVFFIGWKQYFSYVQNYFVVLTMINILGLIFSVALGWDFVWASRLVSLSKMSAKGSFSSMQSGHLAYKIGKLVVSCKRLAIVLNGTQYQGYAWSGVIVWTVSGGVRDQNCVWNGVPSPCPNPEPVFPRGLPLCFFSQVFRNIRQDSENITGRKVFWYSKLWYNVKTQRKQHQN